LWFYQRAVQQIVAGERRLRVLHEVFSYSDSRGSRGHLNSDVGRACVAEAASKQGAMLKSLLPVAFVLFGGASVPSPEVYVQTKQLNVPAVRGRVVFSWKGSTEEPVPNVAIELRTQINDEWQTVARSNANESGDFNIRDVRPGNYDIVARKDGFRQAWARIRVVEASESAMRKKSLVLILEPLVPGACGDARVEKPKSRS
jgi:hypothetical protein